MVHPCCGFSLRNGSVILAILDIIGSVFGTLSTTITLIAVTGFKEELKGVNDQKNHVATNGFGKMLGESSGLVIGMLVFVALICLIEFGLAILLLQGAKERKSSHCNIWWKTKCIMFLVAASFVIFALVTSDDRLDFLVCGIFGIAYQLYSLWVVKAFINELEFESNCEAKGIQKL